MTSQAPAWEGIGSLPEIHIVQGPLQASLNSSVAFSRAEDRETAQLGKGFYGQTMRIFHGVTFYCVLMCCHESRESPRRPISGFSILSSSFVYWACFYQGFSANEIKVFCF